MALSLALPTSFSGPFEPLSCSQALLPALPRLTATPSCVGATVRPRGVPWSTLQALAAERSLGRSIVLSWCMAMDVLESTKSYLRQQAPHAHPGRYCCCAGEASRGCRPSQESPGALEAVGFDWKTTSCTVRSQDDVRVHTAGCGDNVFVNGLRGGAEGPGGHLLCE